MGKSTCLFQRAGRIHLDVIHKEAGLVRPVNVQASKLLVPNVQPGQRAIGRDCTGFLEIPVDEYAPCPPGVDLHRKDVLHIPSIIAMPSPVHGRVVERRTWVPPSFRNSTSLLPNSRTFPAGVREAPSNSSATQQQL